MRAEKRNVSQNSNAVEKKIADALTEFSRTQRWLVGVSGGRDSVVLLHLLNSLGFHKLVVCHLDHGLRGAASRADARFVGRLAKKYAFDFAVEKCDVRANANTCKQSVETAAREARYEFFAKVARAKKCGAIFLAHHADDRVETFLFNLFRGAGVAGLGAMRFDSARFVERTKLRVVRPLLGVWRSEIDGLVRERRIAFREDASNADLAPARNRTRHQIIPMLGKFFGREIRRSIWRAAEILSAENDFIEGLIDSPEAELSIPELRGMPLALQRRTLHAWLKKMHAPDVGFDEIEAIRALIAKSATAAKINLPGGLHARRRAKKLFVE
jgi:tRNA(Ile)-lysidine synthase